MDPKHFSSSIIPGTLLFHKKLNSNKTLTKKQYQNEIELPQVPRKLCTQRNTELMGYQQEPNDTAHACSEQQQV